MDLKCLGIILESAWGQEKDLIQWKDTIIIMEKKMISCHNKIIHINMEKRVTMKNSILKMKKFKANEKH